MKLKKVLTSNIVTSNTLLSVHAQFGGKVKCLRRVGGMRLCEVNLYLEGCSSKMVKKVLGQGHQ